MKLIQTENIRYVNSNKTRAMFTKQGILNYVPFTFQF